MNGCVNGCIAGNWENLNARTWLFFFSHSFWVRPFVNPMTESSYLQTKSKTEQYWWSCAIGKGNGKGNVDFRNSKKNPNKRQSLSLGLTIPLECEKSILKNKKRQPSFD